jgi:hypothetical protein
VPKIEQGVCACNTSLHELVIPRLMANSQEAVMICGVESSRINRVDTNPSLLSLQVRRLREPDLRQGSNGASTYTKSYDLSA